jgi:hypothetical protein
MAPPKNKPENKEKMTSLNTKAKIIAIIGGKIDIHNGIIDEVG